MESGIDIKLVLGAFGGMLVGFYGIAKVMLAQSAKDRDADRQERKELSKAIQDMAAATGRVADASAKGAQEAEQRNGHLAELVVQNSKICAEVLDTVKEIK